ncbi:capsid protein, partial [Escherichia coli]|nr:capsid protein [Escherichia coli]
MNKNIQPARDREREIMNRAASVMAMTVDPTTDAAGNMIADQAVMMENLDKAIQKVPMFEGVNPEVARQITGGWAMSLHEYKRQHGHYPASDILANAHMALERLMTECASDTHEGTGKAMFESVAQSMRSSDGVMKVAQYA